MKRVLLALSWYDQLLHEGVVSYATDHGWYLDYSYFRNPGTIPHDWRGDGVITLLFGRKTGLAQFVASLNVPTITVMHRNPTLPYPHVTSDIPRAADMAYRYFREEKGFSNFGVYSAGDSLRSQTFASCLEGHGFDCRRLNASSNWDNELKRVKEWLDSAPKPMAVYCNNDDLGVQLINAAVESGIRVPYDVSVLGTDNTPMVCKSSAVQLSSIDTHLYAVGYEAAACLDRMMTGEPPPDESILIPPKGIVERASTDTFAASIPMVRKALTIMRDEFRQGITIADVVAETGVSHDGLKKAFHREFSRPPSTILKQIRMKEAAKLLIITKEKVRTICGMVGMGNEKYFSTAFKNYFGMSPKDYRKQGLNMGNHSST